MSSRGTFIVFEGCDRCGKTTQAKLLVQNLSKKGIPAEFMQFPDRSSEVGSLISSYLKSEKDLEDHVIHLLFTANRWEFRNKILSLLKSGINLIVDRYSYSGVAFSSAKKGMDFNWCRQPEVGLPAPDLVVFLELSAEEAAKRGQFGKERYESTEMQKLVRKAYENLKDETWRVVEADESIEKIELKLLSLALDTIGETKKDPIATLWSKT